MPPRFRYWTIVIDGVATAFRAHESQELVPTLRQLQRRTPAAILMWFENGRLWRSPDEARRAALERRRPRPRQPASFGRERRPLRGPRQDTQPPGAPRDVKDQRRVRRPFPPRKSRDKKGR